MAAGESAGRIRPGSDGQGLAPRQEPPAAPTMSPGNRRPLRPAAGPEGEVDPGVDEEIKKQLRSLGYI